jgi:tRNA(fMet)-specific endonuclease VapC
MLDTNICIRLLRDRNVPLRARFNAESAGLCISTILLTESLHGAVKSARPIENRNEVELFAARLGVMAFDAEAATQAGDIRAVLVGLGFRTS